jgi:hypothetical protein
MTGYTKITLQQPKCITSPTYKISLTWNVRVASMLQSTEKENIVSGHDYPTGNISQFQPRNMTGTHAPFWKVT